MCADDARMDLLVSLLQGLLDSEILLPEEVEPLLAQADAAAQSRTQGDEESARRLLESLAREGEALVQAGLLDAASGSVLVRTIHQVMQEA